MCLPANVGTPKWGYIWLVSVPVCAYGYVRVRVCLIALFAVCTICGVEIKKMVYNWGIKYVIHVDVPA